MADYAPLFAAAGRRENVDPRLLAAIAQVESSDNPKAVNAQSDAAGLMQIIPATAKSLGVNPMDPTQAVNGAARLIRQNLNRYGNVVDAVAAYHGGTDPKNWGPKTKAYVEKVAEAYHSMPSRAPQASAGSEPVTLDFLQQTATPKAGAPTTANNASPAASGAVDLQWLADSAKAPPAPPQKGIAGNLKAGMEDVLRVPGEWLDRQLHGTILGNALRVPSAAQDQATFERDHRNLGNSLPDQAARFAGQAVMAAPVLATGEGAIGAIGDAAGGALDAAGADGLGTGARAAANFLRGAGGKNMGGAVGLGVRGASLATEGAAQGAGYGALTGGHPIQDAKIGAIAGPALGAAGAVIGSTAGHAVDSLRPTATKAAGIVRNALMADGVSPADAAAAVGEHGNTLVNAPSANVSALAQAIAHRPGPGAQIIRQSLEQQAASVPSDLGHAVLMATGSKGDVHDLADAVEAAQRQAAAPLYERAFAGGSIAPLEKQFEEHAAQTGKALASAQKELQQARGELTQAHAKSTQTHGDVYASSSANEALRNAQGKVADAEAKVADAQAAHDAIRNRLQQAQEDRTAEKPGAVWSPRIQQFLDDRLLHAGLAKGVELQRLESLAEGKPFNPTQYAVTGVDENGNPIVGAVPNMRTLDAAKRGLDAIIRSHTDPVTGKVDQYGRAVTMVNHALKDEIDRLNPTYAAARAAYAGPAAVRDAIDAGRKALNDDAEITAKQIKNMSEGERQAFQAGVARALIDRIDGAPDGTNAARKIFGNEKLRKRIAAAFDDPARFKEFQKLAEAKSAQVAARNEVLKGSQTAARQAAQGHNWAGTLGHAIYEAAVGSPQRGALMVARHAALQARSQPDPALETAIANLLTNPDQAEVRNALTSAAPGIARRAATGAVNSAGRALRLYGPVSSVETQRAQQ